ncbi:Pre-mRNA-splicing factor spp2 [Mycena sanguinolenta]|uniref:Pre-mRNA-splicing factor spp2 n=1 Tax=Mycena sanguinolenta TaxID=230812 RepID=A0A8H6ZBB4_9AGAR|nr:Pre-mRNA-splicing factor spp2 [Mycena sanguinolenta]
MSKVSFTIRRPTPVSRDASSGPDSDTNFRAPALPRHLAQDSAPGSPLSRSRTSSPARYHEPDSSDEEDEAQDELVSAFDAMGAQRLHPSKKVPQGPLIIPALKNRDWRELARKRRSAGQFVPDSAQAATGKDGSVGGLGTRDTINSGPVLSGLQVRAKKEEEVDEVADAPEVEMVDRALRAILADAEGLETRPSVVDIIPTPMSEADAYKQDVDELPDAATLDDYNRVPVEQFGLALLRGMGWKEGTAASRKPGKGTGRRRRVKENLAELGPPDERMGLQAFRDEALGPDPPPAAVNTMMIEGENRADEIQTMTIGATTGGIRAGGIQIMIPTAKNTANEMIQTATDPAAEGGTNLITPSCCGCKR